MAFFSTNSNAYVKAIKDLVKPEYQSQYGDTISNLMDKIANREEFSYDFNADPLYQNYKDQYTKLGNEAAMNAAASASALTGGYGNSYAATAASQANQQYLTQLNSMIPELYNAAMNKYQMETEDLYNQFGMYETEEQRLYGQHRDNVSDYYNDWSNLQNGYATALAQENSDRAFNYNVYRDNVSDSQWNTSRNDSNSQWQQQFDWNKETWQKEYELKQKAAAKSGSKTGKNDNSNTGSYNGSIISLYNDIFSEFKNTAEKKVKTSYSGSQYFADLIDKYQAKYGFSDSIADQIMSSFIGN